MAKTMMQVPGTVEKRKRGTVEKGKQTVGLGRKAEHRDKTTAAPLLLLNKIKKEEQYSKSNYQGDKYQSTCVLY